MCDMEIDQLLLSPCLYHKVRCPDGRGPFFVLCFVFSRGVVAI